MIQVLLRAKRKGYWSWFHSVFLCGLILMLLGIFGFILTIAFGVALGVRGIGGSAIPFFIAGLIGTVISYICWFIHRSYSSR
jgi:uncharacterized membrane protein YhaH (DUF805 family)